MARLDDRRVAVAILPAGHDLVLLALPDEPDDDVEAGAGVFDRFDGRSGRRQREQREDLAQVPPELIAEARDRSVDVAGDQRVGEDPGLGTNGGIIHGIPPFLRL